MLDEQHSTGNGIRSRRAAELQARRSRYSLLLIAAVIAIPALLSLLRGALSVRFRGH
jgi:hypothetical protein